MYRFSNQPAALVLSFACAIGVASCSSSAHTAAAPSISSSGEVTTAAASTTQPQKVLSSCAILTQAQAATLAATAVAAGVESGQPGESMCQYISDPNGPTAQISVFVGPGAKKQLDIDKGTLKHDFTTLAGVGDEAYLEPGDMFIRKGTQWVSVDVVAIDEADTQVAAGLKAIAPVIVSKL